MKPAAYLISNATARELRFDPLAIYDKWHTYSTPPVETPLYTIPADQVLVPRATLERFMQKIHNRAEYDDVKAARAELDLILHP